MIFSKALATVFAFAGTSLAQSLSGWSQTTIMIGTKTTVMLLPTSLPDLSGTIMSCTASSICDEHATFGEYSDAGCKVPTTECICVAYNSTGYASCIKDKCGSSWESFLDSKLKTCTDFFKVDLSGSTTYNGPSVPTYTPSFNVTVSPDEKENKEGGLSLSDKIALGIGVGFGIPTIIIGVGTLVCVRRRKARAVRELTELAKDEPSPQPSPQPSLREKPEVEAQWPLRTHAS